jgi:hypothetical protein
MSNECPVIWRGRVYPSQSAAAAAAGVSASVAHYHLRVYGHLDRMGQGKGRPHLKPWLAQQQPVTIAGRTWPSQAALARHIGCSRSGLSAWLRRGQTDVIIARLMAAEMRIAG